jgi:hypothetical protein
MVAGGDSCQGCCPVLNFFVSPATAERWLSEHPRARHRDLDAGGRRCRTSGVRRRAHAELMPRSIDRHEVQQLTAEQQAQLVEVLPAAEYADEHLPGAINIPLKELDRETTSRLDQTRPVIVYCYDTQ